MAHSRLGLCLCQAFPAALPGCWGSTFSGSTLTSTFGIKHPCPRQTSCCGHLPLLPSHGLAAPGAQGWAPTDKQRLQQQEQGPRAVPEKPQPSLRAPQGPIQPPSAPQQPACGTGLAALAPLPTCCLAAAPFPGGPGPAPTLACPTANFGKDISGVFLLDSHFLRINSLIDADSLKKRSGVGGGEMGRVQAPPAKSSLTH